MKQKRVKKTKNTLTKKVAKLAKQIKVQRPETLYSESSILAQRFSNDPTSSYVYAPYSVIGQSLADLSGRKGDEITVLKHQVKMILNHNVITASTFRITCVCVKQNTETLITPTNIGNILFDSNFTASAYMPICPLDYDNRKNFKMLYDKTFTINPADNGAASSDKQRLITVNLRPPKRVQYWHTTNNISKGEIFWIFTTDTGTTAASFATIMFRTYYIDP